MSDVRKATKMTLGDAIKYAHARATANPPDDADTGWFDVVEYERVLNELGYCIAPLEATEEMKLAVFNTADAITDPRDTDAFIEKTYRAAIAARPKIGDGR